MKSVPDQIFHESTSYAIRNGNRDELEPENAPIAEDIFHITEPPRVNGDVYDILLTENPEAQEVESDSETCVYSDLVGVYRGWESDLDSELESGLESSFESDPESQPGQYLTATSAGDVSSKSEVNEDLNVDVYEESEISHEALKSIFVSLGKRVTQKQPISSEGFCMFDLNGFKTFLTRNPDFEIQELHLDFDGTTGPIERIMKDKVFCSRVCGEHASLTIFIKQTPLFHFDVFHSFLKKCPVKSLFINIGRGHEGEAVWNDPSIMCLPADVMDWFGEQPQILSNLEHEIKSDELNSVKNVHVWSEVSQKIYNLDFLNNMPNLKELSLNNLNFEYESHYIDVSNGSTASTFKVPNGLEHLNLRFNKLISIPFILPERLKCLDLSSNKLSYVDHNYLQEHLKSLEFFNLSCNPNYYRFISRPDCVLDIPNAKDPLEAPTRTASTVYLRILNQGVDSSTWKHLMAENSMRPLNRSDERNGFRKLAEFIPALAQIEPYFA